MLGSSRYLTRIAAVCACLLVVLLFPSAGEAVELTMNNDLKENDDGSNLIVEDARSVESPKTKLRFDLVPGESKRITNGNVTSFILTRVFPDHKVKYDVICAPEAKGSAVITLLKIHNNELPDGCKVTRTGHWSKRTGMNWDAL